MTGAFALVLFFTLPESARWAVATHKPRERIALMLAPFSRGFVVHDYARFILPDERKAAGGVSPIHKLRELFRGPLAFVTPLIWAAYFCSSFAIYLMSAYAVIFMENLGIPRQNAARLGSLGPSLALLAALSCWR